MEAGSSIAKSATWHPSVKVNPLFLFRGVIILDVLCPGAITLTLVGEKSEVCPLALTKHKQNVFHE